MEETKWLTKGKIILMVIAFLIICGVVAFIIVHKNNVKKEYIKFQSQLEYAAPNYLLKERITLKENEWREIDIKNILKQKLVINKRASDCQGYVIAQAHQNKKTNEVKTKTQESDTSNSDIENNEGEISSNITYKAYITCKKVYTTNGYGTKPQEGSINNEETQTQNDTEKPVIKLFGDEKITINVEDEYEELGAIATDNIDGDLTSKIKISGKVDTSMVGSYTITYTVTDSSKNKATKQRIVEVIEEENPLDDPDEFEDDPEENWENPDESEWNTDDDPDYNTTPSYTSDTTAPIITFNNSSAYQTICTGDRVDTSVSGPYGYIARDNVDGNITNKVKISGSTGIINRAGIYKIYYSVTDSSGNKANATKQFMVKNCGVAVAGMEITPNNRTISVSGTFTIMVSIKPSNATDKSITFLSSNPSVATVSTNGLVRGISRGTAKITITSSNGIKKVCTVTVN